MKGINLALLVVALISGFNLYVSAKSDWKSEEVTQLMKLLVQYGDRKLKEYNSSVKRKDAEAIQFLVVSVLSEAEMIDSRNWQHLPDSLTKESARVDFIVNSKDCAIIRTKCTVHGEVLMLYERADLERMFRNLNEPHGYAVLYSHYIPCSDIPRIGYSCAEELGNHAMYNREKYNMLVGYNEIFKNTNGPKSIEFMIMGGIELFQLKDNVVKPISSSNVNRIKKERFLQNLFYGCLDSTTISEKCCIAKKNNPEVKKQILAKYVNNVVYSCTTNFLKSLTGKLTGVHKFLIRQCMDKYVEQHTGQDCPFCGAKTIVNSIKVCAFFASEFGTEIGKPSNLNEPYLPAWGKGPAYWGSLYEGYNVDADINRPGVFCLKRTNDIDSLCSKYSIPNEEITESIRTKFKDLRKSYGKN